MLTCREILRLATEYFEGALAPEERLRFERHVAICPPCRGFLAQLRAVHRASGQLSEESLSPETRNALVRSFRAWSGGE